MKFFELEHRCVIKVEGGDRFAFLQALLTNDITKVSSNPQYFMLLTPQGRFLYDFYIVAQNDSLLLDCQDSKLDEIIKKLSMYKLRQNVQISKTDLKVFINLSSFERMISHVQPQGTLASFDEYEIERIKRKIPDADNDFIFERSIPLEFGEAVLQGIDFHKGCYIGQEVIARTQYRGVIRKSLHVCTYDMSLLHHPKKESEIYAAGKKLGVMLGSYKGFALALLSDEEFKAAKAVNAEIECDGIKLEIND